MELAEVKKRGGGKPKKRKLNKEESEDKKLGPATKELG
jgi:hypothetical protein